MTEKNDLTYDRSSHRRYSVRKVVLRNFTKFTGKHLCQSLFFNKVAGLRPATLLKRRLWPEACNFIEKKDWHSFFPMNFVKFLRTLFFFTEHPWTTVSVLLFISRYKGNSNTTCFEKLMFLKSITGTLLKMFS